MSDTTILEFPIPHRLSEVICVFCGRRWLVVRPESMKLKELECTCGREGGVIETGENLD